jgi:hypothetical protein
VALSCASDWILVVAGTLLVSQLEDGPRSGAQSVPFLLTLE